MTPDAAGRFDDVQSLILRTPAGPEVAHLVLTVPAGHGMGLAAARVLKDLPVSHGVRAEGEPFVSVGISFAGLEALCVPEAYLRILRRGSPAFAVGALLRSAARGDGPVHPSLPLWEELQANTAHVLISWHGKSGQPLESARRVAARWRTALKCAHRSPRIGRRLGSPDGDTGEEWVHFGFRDGLSEVYIDNHRLRPRAPDCRRHKAGALLLGHVNDNGANAFALPGAPEKVRQFFADSSFGMLRPMLQDTVGFAQQIGRWRGELSRPYGGKVSTDFVKAKLCGRWPDGRIPKPGDLTPTGGLVLDLDGDSNGEGCPFSAHVRRMRPPEVGNGNHILRPLQRRSVPFGPADWDGTASDGEARGLIGHFFAATIEEQFEHLLGQWAARAPLGTPADGRVADPLLGPHGGCPASMTVPLKDRQAVQLTGFTNWTLPLGTLYAWYPSHGAWQALLNNDFVEREKEGPWL